MQYNLKVPEELKRLVENVVAEHLEYSTNNITQDKIKVVKIEIKQIFYNILHKISKKMGDIFEEEPIRRKTGEILENIPNEKNSSEELLVYNSLRKIYLQTNNLEKQRYRNFLLRIYMESVDKHLQSLNRNSFHNLIKRLTPVVKLEILLENLENRNEKIESSSEFLEFISCPILTREDCFEILINKYQSNNYDLTSFEMIHLQEEQGFLGDYYKLKIKTNHHANEVLHLFAKYIHTSEESRRDVALFLFKKEEFMYKKLIPMFKNYGIDGLSDFAPKFYLSKTNECIVLDDISMFGYTLSNGIRTPADYAWTVMVAKKISSLHACSIILEEKLKQENGRKIYLDEIFGEFLEDPKFSKGYPGTRSSECGREAIHRYLIQKASHICTNMSVENFQKKIKKFFEKLNGEKSEHYYNVVLHGDIWGRNILANDSMDCLILDFQMIHYHPPAIDLLFLMYYNTDRSFRLKYMDKIVDIYYDTLQNNLNLYNVDINNFYTREKFFQSVNYYKSLVIIDSLCGFQFILFPPSMFQREVTEEEIVKYYFEDRGPFLDEAWNDEVFRSRVTDLIKDLYDIHANI